MKNIFRNIIIVNSFLLLFATIISTHVYAQELKEIFRKKELRLDSSLTANNERWKPKIPGSFVHFSFHYYLPKVSFGPFKIIDIDKINSEEISYSKKNELLFWTSITDIETKVVPLMILYDKTDSISVNILFEILEQTTYRNLAGSIIPGSKDKENVRQTILCKEMLIKLPGDKLLWHFVPSNISPENSSDAVDHYGKLICGQDTIDIQYAKGFKGLARIEKNYHTGILFIKINQQLAALQFAIKQYVWLTTAGDKRTRMLLGSVIAAFLAIGINQ